MTDDSANAERKGYLDGLRAAYELVEARELLTGQSHQALKLALEALIGPTNIES